jgi:CelD/BcsL family acetyltransferase involved in cellulose biosynthesis
MERTVVAEEVLPKAGQTGQDPLEIEVITDFERFRSIAGEWDGLVDRAGVERVFLCHAWLRTWWEAFGGDKELYVLTVRMAGELVGAVPMMRSSEWIYGFKMDSVASMYNPHTPRFDFVIAKDLTEVVYRGIWDHLCHRTSCDMVVLRQIPDNSPTLPALERLANTDGWLSGQWITPPSPYVELNCEYEELLDRLKGGYRYNLRKRYERLRKIGPIDVEVITERQHVREAMEDGLRIEAAAWKGQEGTAIISNPAVREFYVRLAERQAELGQLRLTFLRVGGKRISFNYVLCSQKKAYAVKIGYDPDYHSYSPGNMHLNLILQDACAEGIAEYDFLGVDDEWKLDWTKTMRGHRWLFLFRNRIRPRFLHYLKFKVVPTIKPHLRELCTYLLGRA